MPLRQAPSFNAVKDSLMEISHPAYKGLNLDDLEYNQSENYSPYMLNMMYRNGSFSKRYGQEYSHTFENTIYAMVEYRGSLIVHSGTSIYKDGVAISGNIAIAEQKGLFVKFNQNLYYYCADIYEYNGTAFNKIDPYIPEVAINLKPDGTGGDLTDAHNMIGTGFTNYFDGDASSKIYHLTETVLEEIVPTVKVNGVEWEYQDPLVDPQSFKVDYSTGIITFKTAPSAADNNVEITAYHERDAEWTSYYNQIVSSKYYACFGGNNNSRLFLAGGGKSTYYYSEVFDASYMPYTNYARVGNGADDITGFGQQYNVLMVFKPTEIYSLTYYQLTSENTEDTTVYGLGAFSSQVVNGSVGCDCPNTIQLINNQLTWFSTKMGVCTLVSTNIVDERNVRAISTNINRTNNMGVKGLLDYDFKETTDIRDEIVSCDFDNKYFLSIPYEYLYTNNSWTKTEVGMCFVWDYKISPFSVTSSKVTSAKDLAWFLFDRFYVKGFINYDNKLLYISNKDSKKVVKLNDSFNDLDFNNDGVPDGIRSYYMTPFMSFGAVDYLKTIKNIYIQCRGDTASRIDLYYYTEESEIGVQDNDSIIINGRIWRKFDWSTFGWSIVNWASVYRRKCSLKKVQIAAFYFKNEEPDRDMSITNIGLQYQIVKYIK